MQEIFNYINQQKMIRPGDAVIAAVSGGGDSMLMLTALYRFCAQKQFYLEVVHVNHQIRGSEADRDQKVVEDYCTRLGLLCTVCSYNVPELSKKMHLGEEETGRILRKEAFKQRSEILNKQGFSRVLISLAHNMNDRAETMIHNLCRGSGLKGLSVLSPVSEGLIRPILFLSSEKISAKLHSYQIPYITDSTNNSDDYTRNRIRHHVLPLLQREVNEKTVEHLYNTAQIFQSAQDYFDQKSEQLLKEQTFLNQAYYFDSSFFEKEKIIKANTLFMALEKLSGKRKDFTEEHIHQILKLCEGPTGKYLSLPYHLKAEKMYDRLYLGPSAECRNSVHTEYSLTPPEEIITPMGTIKTRIFSRNCEKIVEKKYTKWFDYDKIIGRLQFRMKKEGDYFYINNNGGTKKLNRYFIDQKIPRKDREMIPLITAENQVLWIIGYRIGQGALVDDTTHTILEITYVNQEGKS